MDTTLLFQDSAGFQTPMLAIFAVDIAIGKDADPLVALLTTSDAVTDAAAKVLASGEFKAALGETLLLHAPGAGGLSSPVGGMDGAIPIRGVETEIKDPNLSAADLAKAAPPVPTVDLRWVATRVQRAAPVVLSEAGGAGVTSEDGSVAAQGASVDTVIGMLADWELDRIAN